MKKIIIPVIVLLIIIFIVGGFHILFQGMEKLIQVLVNFFPLFKPIIKHSLKKYIRSSYFISSIIIFIFSTLGIIFSAKKRKTLILIISSILDIISLLSVISNLMVCE